MLTRGAALVGSKGVEYDLDQRYAGLDPRERLVKQRRHLTAQLGLTQESGVSSVGTLFDAQDLELQHGQEVAGDKRKRGGDAGGGSGETGGQEIIDELAGLSARERNRARRLAKAQANKPRSRHVEYAAAPSSSAATGIAVTDQAGDSGKIVVESKVDALAYFASADEWPFQARCEELCNDLFSPMWEERHGAAIGLREILKTHAGGAGRMASTPAVQQQADNTKWLDDIAIRLVCVIALDRYGDYASAQVVAPVREMCAQALAAIMHHAPYDSVRALRGGRRPCAAPPCTVT